MAEPVVCHFHLFIFNLIFNGGRADHRLDKIRKVGKNEKVKKSTKIWKQLKKFEKNEKVQKSWKGS
jgi:hypothetical protein